LSVFEDWEQFLLWAATVLFGVFIEYLRRRMPPPADPDYEPREIPTVGNDDDDADRGA
jgi:hypothetical protein